MFEAGYEGGRVEEATSEEEVGVGEVRRVWRYSEMWEYVQQSI